MTDKMKECMEYGSSHFKQSLTKAEYEMLNSIIFWHKDKNGNGNVNVGKAKSKTLYQLQSKEFISGVYYGRKYYSAIL